MKLENFVGMMTGHFDNKDQFNKMQAEGKIYPYPPSRILSYWVNSNPRIPFVTQESPFVNESPVL